MKPVGVDIHIERLAALKKCNFPPSSTDKSFVLNTRLNTSLSDRQRHYIAILTWKYRAQIPQRLVPKTKPDNLILSRSDS